MAARPIIRCGVDPSPSRDWANVILDIAAVRGGRRPWDGSWQGISGKVCLEVEKPWVFVEQAGVARAWGQGVPLGAVEHRGQGFALVSPAGATPDGVLLRFLLLVAPSAERRVIRRETGLVRALL